MFIEVPSKERIWVRAPRSPYYQLASRWPPAPRSVAMGKCLPQFLSLLQTNTYYPFSLRILGICLVQTTVTKVVCLPWDNAGGKVQREGASVWKHCGQCLGVFKLKATKYKTFQALSVSYKFSKDAQVNKMEFPRKSRHDC